MTESPRRYSLLISPPPGQAFGDVARALEAAGFTVEQALDAIGVIVGRIDAERVPALRAIPGVASVEEERTVRPQDATGDCPESR